MSNPDPSEAWFTIEFTYGEAKALRSQIGDLPKSHVGPRLIALYRDLDARLCLAGSPDDGPPRLTVVRERVFKVRQKRPKPVRTLPENPCPACRGEGIVDGVVCAPCRGFGDLG